MCRRRGLGRVCALIVACAAALGVGCANHAADRQRLRSTNPLERAEATVRLAEGGDAEAVHKLVDLLDDPDRAVRMYAILALRRLCGEDFGYRHYDGPAKRAPAVERWREALRDGMRFGRATAVEPVPEASVAGQPDAERGPAAGR